MAQLPAQPAHPAHSKVAEDYDGNKHLWGYEHENHHYYYAGTDAHDDDYHNDEYRWVNKSDPHANVTYDEYHKAQKKDDYYHEYYEWDHVDISGLHLWQDTHNHEWEEISKSDIYVWWPSYPDTTVNEELYFVIHTRDGNPHPHEGEYFQWMVEDGGGGMHPYTVGWTANDGYAFHGSSRTVTFDASHAAHRSDNVNDSIALNHKQIHEVVNWKLSHFIDSGKLVIYGEDHAELQIGGPVAGNLFLLLNRDRVFREQGDLPPSEMAFFNCLANHDAFLRQYYDEMGIQGLADNLYQQLVVMGGAAGPKQERHMTLYEFSTQVLSPILHHGVQHTPDSLKDNLVYAGKNIMRAAATSGMETPKVWLVGGRGNSGARFGNNLQYHNFLMRDTWLKHLKKFLDLHPVAGLNANAYSNLTDDNAGRLAMLKLVDDNYDGCCQQHELFENISDAFPSIDEIMDGGSLTLGIVGMSHLADLQEFGDDDWTHHNDGFSSFVDGFTVHEHESTFDMICSLNAIGVVREENLASPEGKPLRDMAERELITISAPILMWIDSFEGHVGHPQAPDNPGNNNLKPDHYMVHIIRKNG